MSKTPVVGLVVPDPKAEGLIGSVHEFSAGPARLNVGVPKPISDRSEIERFLDRAIPQARLGLLQAAKNFQDEFSNLVNRLEEGHEPYGLNPNLSYRLSDLMIQYQKLESLRIVADLVDK